MCAARSKLAIYECSTPNGQARPFRQFFTNERGKTIQLFQPQAGQPGHFALRVLTGGSFLPFDIPLISRFQSQAGQPSHLVELEDFR